MKLDRTTLNLFGDMPREVSLGRFKVYSVKALERYVANNNGVDDCFVSVSTVDGLTTEIYWDVDIPEIVPEFENMTADERFSLAFEETKSIYSYLLAKKYSVIPVASGMKGFNLHLRLKPKHYEEGEAKKLVKNATLFILCEVFGYDEETKVINCKSIDPNVVGNLRRVCRIPKTLRPPDNLNWCTYLPPDFHEMELLEVMKYMKGPHDFEYDLSTPSTTLEDFPDAPEGVKVLRKRREIEELNVGTIGIESFKGHAVLQQVLRPCLYRHLVIHNPLDEVRFAATIDLLQFFSKEDIFVMYKSLGWIDFDAGRTLRGIDGCKGYQPYSCSRLRELGIPKVCCIG